MENKRNYEIELYRFIMILSITILHFSEDYTGLRGILPGGYLGVDFFFIISGVFLYLHYYRQSYSSKQIEAVSETGKYFLGRLKKLVPPYFLAIGLMIIIQWWVEGLGGWKLYGIVRGTIWQWLGLHFLGAPAGFIMRSIWFISPLIVLYWLIYFLLTKNKEWYLGIAPICGILLLVFIARNYGSLSMQGEYIGLFSGGLIRGFAEMSLGCFLGYIIMEAKQKEYKVNRLIGWGIRILCIAVIVCIMVRHGFDINDFIILPAFIVLIFISFIHPINTLAKISGLCRFLGEVSYYIFLFHLPVSTVLCKVLPGNGYLVMLLIFEILTVVFCSILKLVIGKISMKERDTKRDKMSL